MELPHRDLEQLADNIDLLDKVATGLQTAADETRRLRARAGRLAVAKSVRREAFSEMSASTVQTSDLCTTASAGLDQAAATFRELGGEDDA